MKPTEIITKARGRPGDSFRGIRLAQIPKSDPRMHQKGAIWRRATPCLRRAKPCCGSAATLWAVDRCSLQRGLALGNEDLSHLWRG